MADHYNCFSDLLDHEIEGRDFRVRYELRNSAIALVAPHGGGIEPGTSEIAEAVAGGEFSYFLFEGIKSSGNGVLHITSTRFRESRCELVIRSCAIAVAIHGADDEQAALFLGGRLGVQGVDQLRSALAHSLGQVGTTVLQPANAIAGQDQRNICNRGRLGAGIQLEISHGLRKSMFDNVDTRKGRQVTKPAFNTFVNAVRRALVGVSPPASRP